MSAADPHPQMEPYDVLALGAVGGRACGRGGGAASPAARFRCADRGDAAPGAGHAGDGGDVPPPPPLCRGTPAGGQRPDAGHGPPLPPTHLRRRAAGRHLRPQPQRTRRGG